MNKALGPLFGLLLVVVAAVMMLYVSSFLLTRHVIDLQITSERSSLLCGDTRITLKLTGPDWYLVEKRAAGRDSLVSSRALTRETLGPAMHELFDRRPDKFLFIETAVGITYGEMIRVLDVARGAGVKGFVLALRGACGLHILPRIG